MVFGGFASVCGFSEQTSQRQSEGFDFVELGLEVLRGVAESLPIVSDFEHELGLVGQQLECVAGRGRAFAGQFPGLHREVFPVCNEHHCPVITALPAS